MRIQGRSTVLLVSLAAAIAVAAVSAWVDSQFFYRKQTQHGLTWARQVAVQAEGLALYARRHGIEDSMGWAVNFLAQGVEPRVMQITKIETARTQMEFYDFDNETFDYVKVSLPEKGIGVRVKIHFPFRGFLDTRSQLTHDLMIAGLIGLLFLALMGATSQRVLLVQARRLEEAVLREEQAWRVADETEKRLGDEVRIKEEALQNSQKRVFEWTGNAKGELIRLGVSVRDLVREASRLAQATAKSREHVLPMRERVHLKICEIREKRQRLKSETLDSRARQRLDSLLREIEIVLEPLATDADLAVHAYTEVSAATDSLNQAISSTKSAVLSQAKLLQEMNGPKENQKRAA